MDFRRVADPRTLRWVLPTVTGAPKKYQTATAKYPNGTRLTFQTPTCPVAIFANDANTTILMTLGPTQTECIDFLHAVERAATEVLERDAQISSCLRPRGIGDMTFRLTAWDDTQWYGVAGDFLKAPPKHAKHAAAILELTGAWISETSWGLKWRVVQMRETQHTAAILGIKRKHAFLIKDSDDDDDDHHEEQTAYAFVD